MMATVAHRKKNWLRISVKALLAVVLLFIMACFIFDQLVQFRMSDKELLTFFESHKVKGEIRYYSSGNRTLRYATSGSDSMPVLLFIHGSPSSLSIYKDYLVDSTFLRTFKMYAVDRPGYGYAGLGNPETSIQKQAKMIRPILDSINKAKHPVIVLGSSYGTSVACRLCMDYPQLVDGLVLVAPSLAPGEEKTYWFTPAVANPLINWFIPRMFKSANAEKIAHRRELSAMLPYWKNIRVPVTYLQGDKDELVYTTNAGFAKKQLVNANPLQIIFFKNRPHFIPFTERPTIRKKILEMAADLSATGAGR